MKLSTRFIPLIIVSILVVSADTAYSKTNAVENTNGDLAQANPSRRRITGRPRSPAPSYPKRLCSFPYFCQPYPSKKPNTVCKLYVSQGANGPLYFYRCYVNVPNRFRRR